MGIRKLVLPITGLMMMLGLAGLGVAQAPAALAVPSCSSSNIVYIHNADGFYLSLNAGPNEWVAGPSAFKMEICILPGAGLNGWDYWQKHGTGQCITWNHSTGVMYDANCGEFPAAQSWGYTLASGGTDEVVNEYAGTCLADNTDNAPVYLYSCAPNGNDNNQNWTFASA